MGHSHAHHHHPDGTKNLRFAFFLNLGFTILEIFGGMYVNSVAILSDALHDLGDSFSLGLAWYLQKKSGQGRTAKFSFGYRRFSLLGALINSLVLVAGSVYIIYEAIGRIMEPETPDATGMIVFAVLGVVVNGLAAWKLYGSKNLNERVVSWHLIEDVLGWVAVLIVAIVLLFADIPELDPILSMVITIFILWNVIKRLKETFQIFLQGVPEDVNPVELEERITAIPKVDSVHHTHVWSLDGEHHVFTTHIKLKEIQQMEEIIEIKEQVKDLLSEYRFSHSTIETELDRETCRLTYNSTEPGK